MGTQAEQIREYGLSIGFTKVGVTTADDFEDFLEVLESRGNDYDFHLASPNRPLEHSRPRTVMPSAKSIVIMALDYATVKFPEQFNGRIAKVYQARCYNPPEGTLNHSRFQLMKDFLAKDGIGFRSDINIPYRWAAARAGVSTFGRNNFAYVSGAGSFVILYGLVIDRELEPDAPTMKCKCPPDCRACVEACPTKALCEPFKLNPRKCLAFNAWKTQTGAGFGISDSIPVEIRENMGQHYHGCDICQNVCPRNRKKLETKYPKDGFLDILAERLTLEKLLAMPTGYYENSVKPLMYNYIKEPRYFQRNAAVAMGNSGDRAYVKALREALAGADEMVREHAAWALGKLGGAEAGQALEAALRKEVVPLVAKEMKTALERAVS